MKSAKKLSNIKKIRLGPVQKKILLLLGSGLALGLTHNPSQYFRVVRKTAQAWQSIERRKLKRSLITLHNLGVVESRRNQDGTIEVVLTKFGFEVVKKIKLDEMKIDKPRKWDGKWRMVIFDIPEENRQARDGFRGYLKRLSFFELQRSVWVHPYDCVEQIQCLIEHFSVAGQVYLIEAAVVSNDERIRKKFDL